MTAPSTRPILFTPETFAMQIWGGVSHSYVRVGEALAAQNRPPHFFAGLHGNRHLQDAHGLAITGARIGKIKNLWKLNLNLSRFWLRLWCLRHPGALIHDTYYWAPYRKFRGAGPYVVCVWDMIAEIYGQESGWSDRARSARRAAVDAADAIIVPSLSTAHDLQRLWSVDPARMVVAPLGVMRRQAPAWTAPAWPFVLHVGGRSRYKDFETTYRTIANLRREGRDLGLVCFGSPLKASEKKAVVATGIPLDRIVETSGTDELLAAIYAAAVALLYPSHYEGFGMPILEAMMQDCPVLCTDTPACLEAAGGAALISRCGDVESFSTHLRMILDHPEGRARLIRTGRQRAESQPWSMTATGYLAAYALAEKNFRLRQA